MRRFYTSFGVAKALAVPVIAAVITGCESTDLALTGSESSPRNPLHEQQYKRVTEGVVDTQSVLVNADFSEPLGNLPGWSACVDDSALSQTIASDFGSLRPSFVDVGPQECILQAVPVRAGDQQTLSCFISDTDNQQWSGMAISYYDREGNFLSESPAAESPYHPFGTEQTRRAVRAIAPDNTDVALAWFYTESGGRIADCLFESTQPEPPIANPQQYHKTLTVERQYSQNLLGGGFNGFGFNGFQELQRYPVSVREQTLIDGIESGDPGRQAQFTFGVTDEHLHVLVSIQKFWTPFGPGTGPVVFTDSYPAAGDLWNDDSFEIYINAGNEATVGYDSNDFVRIYGYRNSATHTPPTVTGFNSQLPLTDEARCNVEGGTNLITCEVRFSLEELGIGSQLISEIGFDIHVNVDDDGGDREAKYSWCGGHTVEAWRDMSVVDCSLKIIP